MDIGRFLRVGPFYEIRFGAANHKGDCTEFRFKQLCGF
jgi:hypothetical protein